MSEEETPLEKLDKLGGIDGDDRSIAIMGRPTPHRQYWMGSHWGLDEGDDSAAIAHELGIPLARALAIIDLIRSLDREALTEYALGVSLCPIHFVDYAICFDDENPECSQIRMVHPGHDT